MAWRWEVWDVLTREYWGDLLLGDVTWNEAVGDVGELTGTLRPSVRLDRDERRELERLVSFERAWLCAAHGRSIPWSGLIQAGPWGGQSIAVKATEAVGWLHEVMAGKTRSSREWGGIDQHRIVRDLVAEATAQSGAPRIAADTAVSGVTRDLVVTGQALTPVADLINTMAGAPDGFDWGVGARYAARDGRPELYLWQAHPERDGGAAPAVELVSHPLVGNVLGVPTLPRDATGRRTVVYATGEGQAPDMMVAADEDPAVAAGLAVRREAVVSYSGSGVADLAALADHAYAERVASSMAVGTLDVDVLAADPDFTTYGAGSRVRLALKDEYQDAVFPAVRVLERTMRCERRGAPDEVTLTLDMADTDLVDGVPL